MQVPDLIWYLSRDLVCAHRVLIGLLTKAKVESSKDERKGYAEPHAEQGQHGCEGNSTRRVLTPDEEVQEEAHAKHYAGVEHGSLREGGGSKIVNNVIGNALCTQSQTRNNIHNSRQSKPTPLLHIINSKSKVHSYALAKKSDLACVIL